MLVEKAEVSLGVGRTLLFAWTGFQALEFGAVAWLARAIDRPVAVRGIVFAVAMTLPAALVPSHFPWSLALYVHDLPVLVQTAEFLGAWGPSLVVACGSAALGELALVLTRRHDPERTWWAPAAPALVVGLACAFGLLRAGSARSTKGVSLTVVVVQTHPAISGEPSMGRHIELSRIALHGAEGALEPPKTIVLTLAAPDESTSAPSARLLMWSEGAAGSLGPLSPTTFGEIMRETVPGPLLLGADVSSEADEVHNTALLFDEYWQVQGSQTKQLLVPLGEYVPSWLKAVPGLSASKSAYVPGTESAPLAFGAHELAVGLCYETVFADLVRKRLSAKPSVLVDLGSDSWFLKTSFPWFHLAHAKLRAVENRRYVIRAVGTGLSGVIDPSGTELLLAPPEREAVVSASARFVSGRTLYARMGDSAAYAAGAFLLALLLLDGKRRRAGRAAS
jgi:apolipoprotein N-acyltransferase